MYFFPWVGCGEVVKLSKGLIEVLHSKGLFFLHQGAHSDFTTIWRHEWKQAEILGLEGRDAEEWEIYVHTLRSSHARIRDDEDELINA